MIKQFLWIYGSPLLLITMVYFVVTDNVISLGDILLLSLLPILTCVYLWALVSHSPYSWLKKYYLNHLKDINNFFNAFVKISLFLFPVLYFSIESMLSQNGYKRIEVYNKTMAEDAYYYRKEQEKKPTLLEIKEHENGELELMIKEVTDETEK